jgi:uncharacterized protein
MKKVISLAALSLAAAFALAPPASAQTPPPPPPPAHVIKPEKRALIKELLELTEVAKMAAQMMDTTMAQMDTQLPQIISQSMLADPNLSPAEREQINQQVAASTARFSKRFRELLPQRVNFGQLMEELYYPLYDKHFTEAELKDLVAFYKSPTGRKFIQATPQLMQEAMAAANQVLTPKLLALLREITEEEKKNLKK